MNNNFYYSIFPLKMLENDLYSHFTTKEFFLYMLLLNRLKLSKQNLNNFSDSDGVFVYYSNQKICQNLRCNHQTATKTLETLENAGLIRRDHQKNGLRMKIYVNDVFNLHLATYNSPRDNTYKPNQEFKPKQQFNSHRQPPTPQKEVSFNTEFTPEQRHKARQNFGTTISPMARRRIANENKKLPEQIR